MSNEKKILYIITKANWGGAQKYVFDLASEMNDYEIVVAYGKPFGELDRKLKQSNIKTIEINGLGRNINLIKELKVVKTLWRILKQEKPDIIHLNSSKIGVLGSLIGRMAGINKIIFTAHGWAFNEDRNWFSKIILKFLSWLTLILSHKTVVINQKEYNQVIHWPFITTNKLNLIYNGIRPINFLNKQEARQKLSTEIKGNDIVVGTISELHKNKGLRYAIEGFTLAVKKNPQLKFIIIGEGEKRESLEKEIQKNNLTDKIFLAGKIESASQYIKAFDIFLLSSLKEGLPFVLLEAGLAKLPVIATEIGGIPEIIENNVSGILIKEKSPDEIKTAIEELTENTEKRQGYGKNLKLVIEEQFSFEEMSEETKKLYFE